MHYHALGQAKVQQPQPPPPTLRMVVFAINVQEGVRLWLVGLLSAFI